MILGTTCSFLRRRNGTVVMYENYDIRVIGCLCFEVFGITGTRHISCDLIGYNTTGVKVTQVELDKGVFVNGTITYDTLEINIGPEVAAKNH